MAEKADTTADAEPIPGADASLASTGTDATAGWLAELATSDDPAQEATRRAVDSGLTVPSPTTGALLRWLAAAVPARTAVEVGASGGVTGLWLLDGMAPKAALTSIEVSSDGHHLARRAYAAAGQAEHVRAVLGSATAVLPRLADSHYDLAVLAGEHAAWPDLVGQVRRVLRPGGVLVALGALRSGAVAEPGDRDATTSAVRTAIASLRDDEDWSIAVLAEAGGLLLGRMRAPGQPA